MVKKAKVKKGKAAKKKRAAAEAKAKPKSQAPKKTPLPKVSVQSITGCAGCQLEIYFIQDALLDVLSKIDLVAAPMIKENNYEGPVDVCFIEGSVTFKEQIAQLKKWRRDAKVIVALGSCATDGGVQQQKHFIDGAAAEKYVYAEKTKHLHSVPPTPISDHIKVDSDIRGCPADQAEIVWFIKQVLLGKMPKQYEKPVCHECKLRENRCLLLEGRECYGPVTMGNCSIMCPDFNHPCTGCRGPAPDANFEEHIRMLEEKGYERRFIMQKLQKYAGLAVKKLMEPPKEDKKK